MNEYNVTIYKIVAKAKTKVRAKNWTEAKAKTESVAKECNFEQHDELRMVMDIGEQ